MAVEVDKAWCDHQAGHVDDAASVELARRDGSDGPASDAHVPLAVEHRFGVYYSPPAQDDVVRCHAVTLAPSKCSLIEPYRDR